MPELCQQLLDATIRHLEELKASGVKYVLVSPSTLAALATPPRPATAASAPGRPARSVETAPVATGPASGRPAPGPEPFVPPAAVRPTTAAPTVSPQPNPFAEILSGPRPAALSPEARAAGFGELRARALACRKCAHLAAARKNVVFGVGDPQAALMFVGEAPGMDEDEQGEPFVGRAGQLLTRIIQAMGLRRDTVYIANILKCRPDTPGQTTGNRKPTADEMNACLPYLLAQIDLIQPRVIVALGGTALEGLFGKSAGITRLRGGWMTFRDLPVMPTFHPSFLLRPENARKKRLVWEDMLQVMEKLGLPISDKQRGYFLPA